MGENKLIGINEEYLKEKISKLTGDFIPRLTYKFPDGTPMPSVIFSPHDPMAFPIKPCVFTLKPYRPGWGTTTEIYVSRDNPIFIAEYKKYTEDGDITKSFKIIVRDDEFEIVNL
jgi:hypothetical protein